MDLFGHSVGLLGWGISRTQDLLSQQDNTTQRNADTSMPRAEFEPAILAFEPPKTVRALDCAATGTGYTAI